MNLFIEKLRGAVRSVTVWFNGVVATIVLALPILQDSIPSLQAYLPPHLFKYLMLAVLIANIWLRFRTRDALEHKG